VHPIAPLPPVVPVPPIAMPPAACSGPNMVVNGSFEAGFTNGVGNYWASYTNGGKADYGFYDEQWPPVVKDGVHGQLIEINTKGMSSGDPDRVAGIYQVVQGLVPGATYQFSVWGMLREEAAHPDEDPGRYGVQWGFVAAPGAGYTPSMITNWTGIGWQPIYVRTAPGAMQQYTAQFVAPSHSIVLAIQAVKKWGTPYRELDVNLDAIQIICCPSSGGGVVVVPPPPPPPPPGGVACGTVYIVKRGDSLGLIARRFGVTVSAIVACNGIKNPNVIYAGQRLCIPVRPAPH
jgi:LysM repeat protein